MLWVESQNVVWVSDVAEGMSDCANECVAVCDAEHDAREMRARSRRCARAHRGSIYIQIHAAEAPHLPATTDQDTAVVSNAARGRYWDDTNSALAICGY